MDAKKPLHHRDQAGHIKYEIGGEILGMVPMADALWCFKRDGAYRTVLPDQIDPQRLHNDLPVQNSWDPTLAAANPVVARMLLQPVDMLRVIYSRAEDDPFKLKEVLFAITRALVTAIADTDVVLQEIERATFSPTSRSPGAFRAVDITSSPPLQPQVDSILGSLKRAAQFTLNIPHYLMGTPHADKLGSFRPIRDHLAKQHGVNAPAVEVFDAYHAEIVRLGKVRNAIEHPKVGQSASVTTWVLGPDGKPAAPTIVHEHDGQVDRYLVEEFLRETISAVFNFAEDLFLACVDHQPDVAGAAKFYIEELSEVNEACPVKYRCRLWWKPGAAPPTA